jgi:hypothetical protein
MAASEKYAYKQVDAAAAAASDHAAKGDLDPAAASPVTVSVTVIDLQGLQELGVSL